MLPHDACSHKKNLLLHLELKLIIKTNVKVKIFSHVNPWASGLWQLDKQQQPRLRLPRLGMQEGDELCTGQAWKAGSKGHVLSQEAGLLPPGPKWQPGSAFDSLFNKGRVKRTNESWDKLSYQVCQAEGPERAVLEQKTSPQQRPLETIPGSMLAHKPVSIAKWEAWKHFKESKATTHCSTVPSSTGGSWSPAFRGWWFNACQSKSYIKSSSTQGPLRMDITCTSRLSEPKQSIKKGSKHTAATAPSMCLIAIPRVGLECWPSCILDIVGRWPKSHSAVFMKANLCQT